MAQRMGVSVLLAFAIAAIPILALMGKEPDLSVLFSDLDREDVQAIVMHLDRQGVPYELTKEGGVIKVPTDRVHELRLQMASQGLPEVGGVGFEIFDRVGLGVTQFVQKMNYRRALQGELARTIGQIAGVDRVRVHSGPTRTSAIFFRSTTGSSCRSHDLKTGRSPDAVASSWSGSFSLQQC